MKKQSILFLAGGLLALASCNNGGENAGMSQAQIDSMVNVQVSEKMVQLQASNDSMINALAQVKADSMIAAMKGSTASAPSRTTRPTHSAPAQPAQPAQPTPPPPPPPNTNTGKINQPQQNGGNAQQGTNTGKRK